MVLPYGTSDDVPLYIYSQCQVLIETLIHLFGSNLD